MRVLTLLTSAKILYPVNPYELTRMVSLPLCWETFALLNVNTLTLDAKAVGVDRETSEGALEALLLFFRSRTQKTLYSCYSLKPQGPNFVTVYVFIEL